MSGANAAFTVAVPLQVGAVKSVSLSFARRTPRLAQSRPQAKPEAPAKSRNGKRIPTFRKLQTRHRSGPAVFRRAQATLPKVVTKGGIAVSTVAPVALETEDDIRQEKGQSRQRKREDAFVLSELRVGQMFDGVVNNLVRHGAYVDIGAKRDGLVHLRDLSIDFVHEVDDWVRPGDKVIVWVKYVDVEKNVLGLTMVRPALGFSGRVGVPDIIIGTRYKAVVQRITNYGAYVDIGAERMGFLHVSALWGKNPGETLEYLRIGQSVWVAVDDVHEGMSYIELVARGVGDSPLTKNGPIGKRVILRSRSKSSSSIRLDFPGDEASEWNGTVTDFEDTYSPQDDDESDENVGALAAIEDAEEGDGDDDLDEFEFAAEMDENNTQSNSERRIAAMVRDETEFVGLKSSDMEKLKNMKLLIEDRDS